ncbi:MAG: GNAT family N-acetyltransferase [Alteripontixanthobacter sp.]
MTAISASYHETVNVLQGMNGKNAFSRKCGPFDRAEWFALLADAGMRPLVAMAQGHDAAAALALTRANGRLEPLRNWYSFTWRPLGAGLDVLTALASDLRGQSHRVTLWPVPDEDGSATMLEAAFIQAGWNVRREHCDHNHVLPVNGRSFAEYWAERPGRMRTTLKRKAKKVDVAIHTHFDAADWADYERIYDNSWKPEEGDPALLRRFAEAEAAAGRMRLAIARLDGLAVAAQFWTVENSVAYIHKLAHLEEHKKLSAGTTLSAALFEHVIDRDRVELVDFGTGNDPYKRDWMEEDRPRYRIDCLDPAAPRAWPALAKRAVQSLRGSRVKAKGSDRTAGEQPV